MEIDDLDVEAQTALFERLAATTPSVLWVFSADWERLVYVNDRYEELWGRSIADLDDDASDFLEGVHPDDRDAVRQAMTEISGGEATELEYRVNADEDYGRWVHVHGLPMRDESGDIVHVAGFAHDVTERRARKRALERKNERLSDFASVLSHDLRNPLTVAMGHLAFAREATTGGDEHFDAVERAHERIDDLIEHLLSLARSTDAVTTAPVSLAAVADACWGSVDTGDARCTVEGDATVLADPERLKQLLENLYRNAIEHAGPAVHVTVEPLADGFAVADDGPGIDPDHREAVFDRGFSTAGDGTGLGLTIVSSIADAHGWTIDLADGDDGARFEVRGVSFVESEDD